MATCTDLNPWREATVWDAWGVRPVACDASDSIARVSERVGGAGGAPRSEDSGHTVGTSSIRGKVLGRAQQPA